jgi:hypothetical protein
VSARRSTLVLLGVLGALVGSRARADIDLVKLGLHHPLSPALAPALEPVDEIPGLPRVLLIGDSISIAYTREVRARLAGRANVQRPPENCGPTVYGLARLASWLGEGPWSVIYFNFGLHDLKYMDEQGTYIVPQVGDRPLATPAEYADNLRALVAQLRATGARLIFATTTPVPAGTLGRVAGEEVRYNEAAQTVMRASGVIIDDLHALVVARPELQLPQNVHFTPEGCASLADQVTAAIVPLLPR